jgi:hypothetical protein
MARKPNYQFERKERERLKASKAAEKASVKREQREHGRDASDMSPAGSPDTDVEQS